MLDIIGVHASNIRRYSNAQEQDTQIGFGPEVLKETALTFGEQSSIRDSCEIFTRPVKTSKDNIGSLLRP